MKTQDKLNRISYEGKDLFVGIDVHKLKWVVSICTRDLELQTFSMSDPTPQSLHRTLEKQYSGATFHLVYEAGFSGYSLYDYFNDRGIDIIVTPPNRLPRDGSRVKTDRFDSRKLARCLSHGMLKEVKVPSPGVRQLRFMFTILDKLKSQRLQLRLQIKSMLHFLDHPLKKARWSKRLQEQLGEAEFEEISYQKVFALLLNHYKRCDEVINEIEEIIADLKEDHRFQEKIGIIQSVKGIGLLSAIRFVLFLFDRDDRFVRGESLAHYLGLAPSEHSSGEKKHKGGITHNGDAHLRGLIVQLAWKVVRWDVALLEKYEGVLQRGGKPQQAIVAVSRKLMVKLYTCLRKKEPYVRGLAA